MIKNCEEEAKAEKERYDAAYSRLPEESRRRIRELQKQLKRKDLTCAERDRIQNEVGSIFGFSF